MYKYLEINNISTYLSLYC